jgi:pyruvate dehydrogenase E1 component alpha subunit/2-oxoisovalerate dehydrogenase E1 component alpha subunit
MLMARMTEERLASLYRSGGRIVGGVYLGKGQEAFSAGLGVQLRPKQDVLGPLIRDLPARLAFGEPLIDGFRTYLGCVTGPMRGRDGNVHRGRPKEGLLAMISHLGSLGSVVSGMLMARRLQGRLGDSIGATSIGDGGTSTGAFHEAVNLAAIERLPLLISVANNQFAYSTPNDRQFACKDLVSRAIGYGIRGWTVDGIDLANCIKGFQLAAAAARSGGGPQMIVGNLLRLSGHGEHDDASYVPDTTRNSRLGTDCLELAKQTLFDRHLADEEIETSWREDCRRAIDAAVAQAGREPLPDPYKESWEALASKSLIEGQSE